MTVTFEHGGEAVITAFDTAAQFPDGGVRLVLSGVHGVATVLLSPEDGKGFAKAISTELKQVAAQAAKEGVA